MKTKKSPKAGTGKRLAIGSVCTHCGMEYLPVIVEMVEYERGWGPRVDELLYFDTTAEAEQYCNDYNAKHNTASSVPDWYYVPDCYIKPRIAGRARKPTT